MLGVVPGLRLAAPRDEATLRAALRAAVDVDDAPTVVRYPKGALVDPVPGARRTWTASTCSRGTTARPTRRQCSWSGRRHGAHRARGGRAPRRARRARRRRRPPLGPAGARGADQAGRRPRPRRHHRGRRGRRRSRRRTSAQRAREAGIATPVQSFGIPRAFLDHATRDQLVDTLRLRPADIARDTLAALGQV